jgi:hypothetical protein
VILPRRIDVEDAIGAFEWLRLCRGNSGIVALPLGVADSGANLSAMLYAAELRVSRGSAISFLASVSLTVPSKTILATALSAISAAWRGFLSEMFFSSATAVRCGSACDACVPIQHNRIRFPSAHWPLS